jgi:hypothetical protein
VIGGLITTTMLTLLVLPALYASVTRKGRTTSTDVGSADIAIAGVKIVKNREEDETMSRTGCAVSSRRKRKLVSTPPIRRTRRSS